MKKIFNNPRGFSRAGTSLEDFQWKIFLFAEDAVVHTNFGLNFHFLLPLKEIELHCRCRSRLKEAPDHSNYRNPTRVRCVGRSHRLPENISSFTASYRLWPDREEFWVEARPILQSWVAAYVEDDLEALLVGQWLYRLAREVTSLEKKEDLPYTEFEARPLL